MRRKRKASSPSTRRWTFRWPSGWREGLRGEISGHRRTGGALRRRSAYTSASAGERKQHPRRRCRQQRGRRALHRVEAQRLAGALCAGGGRAAFSGRRTAMPTACSVHDAHLALLARLQHQPGEGRGRTEELRRSARSEVDGQDGEGAIPAYSGTIMTATFQIARDLGWEYLREARRQKVMQVQSSTDPPKKLALGERAVMADGNDYNLIQLKERGEPVEVVYPAEGTPIIAGPTGIFKSAPNPNAARLFQSWLHSREGQQLLVDFARPAFGACAGRRQARPPQAVRDQADEGRCRGVEARPRRSRRAMRSCSGCEC